MGEWGISSQGLFFFCLFRESQGLRERESRGLR